MIIEKSSGLETRVFPGLVQSAGETRLAFRVSGVLSEIHVLTGQKVRKGESIARIDPRDFKLTVLRLQASLEEAIADLEAMENGARKEDIVAFEAQVKASYATFVKNQKQLNRFDQLVRSQFITNAQHEQAVADFTNSKAAYDTAFQTLEKAKKGARTEDIHAAKARIKQLKASLSAGEYALKDTVLKAPFDGIVNNRFVEKYETIGTDQPIVSLLDFKSVDVKTAIPEQIMLKRSVFTKISCTLEAYPDMVFPATIKELGLKTDTANQSFPLIVSLDKPDGIDIQSGMAASLIIEYPRENMQNWEFLLPSTAVFSDSNGRAGVWKIDPQTLKVSKVLIKAGRVKKDVVFATAELQPGDRIVTAGARFLIQDQKVCLLNHSQGN